MEIEYSSSRLQKELETEKKLVRVHGAERAELVKQRLFELWAADTLEDLRHLPGPRLHQHIRLKGQGKATFSVDLDHPYRLLFEVAHDPEPVLPGGGVDWTKVTSIMITGIEDPHGRT